MISTFNSVANSSKNDFELIHFEQVYCDNKTTDELLTILKNTYAATLYGLNFMCDPDLREDTEKTFERMIGTVLFPCKDKYTQELCIKKWNN